MKLITLAQNIIQQSTLKSHWLRLIIVRQILPLLTIGLLLMGWQGNSFAAQQNSEAAPPTPEELQQLVAPIALYPDALVAQILAASTYPTQVVEADRWLQQHPSLQGEQLASSVDRERWDPSVKALTAFPDVLANMDRNLSWTTELGDVYFNDQQGLLDAVQVMRHRAEDANNLKSTSQQRVVNDGPTIIVEPVYRDVCYLPSYDPWLVYGAPIIPFPGYYYGEWFGPGAFVSFGPAINLGFFGGFGWGWPAWGFNWGSRVVVFNRAPFVSHSRFFFNHGAFGQLRGGFPVRRGVFAPNTHWHNHASAGRQFNWSRPNGFGVGRSAIRSGGGWSHRGGGGHHR
jgi:hypothetical protein